MFQPTMLFTTIIKFIAIMKHGMLIKDHVLIYGSCKAKHEKHLSLQLHFKRNMSKQDAVIAQLHMH